MIVKQAYQVYQTPENLQRHMLGTAALANIVLENWIGIEIDKDAIVKACTIHDIAKPMKFDLAKQAQYGMSENDIEALRKLQNRIKTTFGDNEHKATIGIAREIGCSPDVVMYIDNLEWEYVPKLLAARDISSLIPIYCDMRIGPKGILSLGERLHEIKERVKGDDYEENVRNGNILEQEIKKNSNVDINSIADNQLTAKFDALLKLELA